VGIVNSLKHFTFNYKKKVLTNKKNLSLFPTFSTCVLFLGIFSLILQPAIVSAQNFSSISDLTLEQEEAAKKIFNLSNVKEPAKIVFVKAESGTILRDAFDDKFVENTLQVPNIAGNYYAFWIDHEPDAFFHHEVSYGWLELETNEYKIIEASLLPYIFYPSEQPTPFQLLGSTSIGNIPILLAKGSGVDTKKDTSKKPAATTYSKTFDCIEGETNRVAVVVDLGDKIEGSTFITSSGAIALAAEAEKVASYLNSNGYDEVFRISQYSGNSHPALQTNGPMLDVILTSYANAFQCSKKSCCHEFFVYVIGHGQKDGDMDIYSVKGVEFDEYFMQSYAQLPGQAPSCVKVILWAGGCYSGHLISDYSGILQSACGSNKCGITAMTSSGPNERSFLPTMFVDSAVDDFMEANNDLDGDGIDGDLGDKFKHMRAENNPTKDKASTGPQLFTCNESQPLCALDVDEPERTSSSSRPGNATKDDAQVSVDFDEEEKKGLITIKSYKATTNQLIAVQVSDPEGIPLLLRTLSVDNEGQANFDFKLDSTAKPGTYGILITSDGYVKYVQFSIPFIPNWIKQNAKFWSNDQITEQEFTNGIQYMIKEEIIKIPNLPELVSSYSDERIPVWVKNNAKWWSENKISDEEFVSGIKFLVEKGIIRVGNDIVGVN